MPITVFYSVFWQNCAQYFEHIQLFQIKTVLTSHFGSPNVSHWLHNFPFPYFNCLESSRPFFAFLLSLKLFVPLKLLSYKATTYLLLAQRKSVQIRIHEINDIIQL